MKNFTSLFKTLFFASICFVIADKTNAQNLFGTTDEGGINNGGVLYNYDILRNQYNLNTQFPSAPGLSPYGNIIQASDGNLYGMTVQGGSAYVGTIFRMTLLGQYTVLASFTNATGFTPRGSLTEGYDGNLYGTTTASGASGDGTLFMFNLANDSITPLVSFNGTNGMYPGNLVLAADSNLYGVTNAGGTGNGGTIYRYNIKSKTLTTIVSFGSGGPNPWQFSIIQGFDGNLYGTTAVGGLGYGTIYKCSTSGSLSFIASFNNTNGRSPCGIMQVATDSNFYGMTQSGGSNNDGVIYKYNSSSGITVLLNFNGTNGNQPNSTLVEGSDGNLYGMTPAGGTGQGNIFQCTRAGVFTNLVSFNGPNGDWPEGALIQATDGNLYGMTNAGGTATNGVLFQCTTSGTITTLESFGVATAGNYPYGGVIQGADGSIYGMANNGGMYDMGSIYRCTLSDTLTTLVNFNGTNGKSPMGSLLLASDGNFYGMTYGGGTSGAGTVFRCTPTGILTTLVNFNGTNGSAPYGGLVQAADGDLYGVTYSGGASNAGVLFRLTLSGIDSVLYSFSGGYEANPECTLIQGTDGDLYGTALGATGTGGILFRYNLSTGVFQHLEDFLGPNGENPVGGVIQGFDGSFYGMTSANGGDGYGTIYKFTIKPDSTGGTIVTLVNFNETNGGLPVGGLIQLADSTLYGVTREGTAGTWGNIFKCTTSGTLTSLYSFNDTTGGQPLYVSLLNVSAVQMVVSTPSCTSQIITASPKWNGKTPFTYAWSNGSTTSSISGITSAGTYTVAVSDDNGITYSGSVTLPAYSPISGTANGSNLICYNDNSGTVNVSVSGGTTPYTYAWSGGQTTSALTGLSAGAYSVTVTDKYGCTTNANETITQPSSSLTAVISGTNVKCSGLSDGSANVATSGGISPYTYLWNDGNTTSGISSLSIGTYNVIVTDNNGCKRYDTISVTQPANRLDSVRICMVTVDTSSLHNVVIWNPSGLNNIDSVKIYYLNSSSNWQMIGEDAVSAGQFTDTNSINSPNKNTVRYCITGLDSCGDQEIISVSPWHNTLFISVNKSTGQFSWAGTGYLIQGISLPVVTYLLYRDTLSNGHWQAIDSVSGTQNTMTDPNYSSYPSGRWRVQARLNISGCSSSGDRPEGAAYTSSRSNVEGNKTVGIAQIESNYNVTVYPNPAGELLNVKFNEVKESEANISITDVTGREITTTNYKLNPDGTIKLDISELPAGVYFMRLTTASFVQVAKFIKE